MSAAAVRTDGEFRRTCANAVVLTSHAQRKKDAGRSIASVNRDGVEAQQLAALDIKREHIKTQILFNFEVRQG